MLQPQQHLWIELHDDVEERLNELPSATTPGERTLMLHYVTTMWDGKTDVFENGPLLGGSTRALALGMLSNQQRDEAASLYTYDWFSFYEPLDVSDAALDQLAAGDEGFGPILAAARESGTFFPVFAYLHARQDYTTLLRPHVGFLPGHRGQEAPDGAATFSIADREFGFALVDGCKSWFGTKYWALQTLPRIPVGGHVMFQDYGWYTCFWIPSLVAAFAERLKLRAYVDCTYAFELTAPISEEDVEERYPDEPDGWAGEEFDETLGRLLGAAKERSDGFGTCALLTQRAAAYAYIGRKDEAREMLDSLLMKWEYLPLRHYLQGARRSPTYTPEGRVTLDA